jgi:hypothetical protein
MDFRRTKFFLALGIMAAGMSLALVWHGWQGWVLHRGYPFNTFLYLPSHRFDDLTQVIDSARQPSPYEQIRAGYFPAAYIIFRLLGQLPPPSAIYLYLSVTCLGLWLILILTLRPMFAEPGRFLSSEIKAILAATGLMLVSYPVWIGLDRANVEFFMGFLVALSLLCLWRRRFYLGLGCLFPAICFKVYPVLLLALFCRPRHLRKVMSTVGLFLIVSLASFVSFANSMGTNWQLWNRNLAFCKYYYLILDGGLGASASLWSTGKGLVLFWCFILAGLPSGRMMVLSTDYVERLYTVYSLLMPLFILLVTAFAVLLEKELFRRATVLLIMMTMAVPYGGDYRLIYINLAMVTLILMGKRRDHDLLAVGLLAFVAIPKREIFFPFLGATDTGLTDVSISIFLNPPCMIAALALLIKSGWPERASSRIRLKARGIIRALGPVSWRRRSVHE